MIIGITVTYTKKEGSEVIKNDYEGDDSEINNIIDAYDKGVRKDKVTLNDVQVLAHSRFSVFVDYMKTTSVYQIFENHLKRWKSCCKLHSRFLQYYSFS